jgi:hypothetical protein
VSSSISSSELLEELSGFGSPLIVITPLGISLLDTSFIDNLCLHLQRKAWEIVETR